jgi:hypothetical protein
MSSSHENRRTPTRRRLTENPQYPVTSPECGLQNDPICTPFAIMLHALEAAQNGGYRSSSGNQRKLQSVTGARLLERRIADVARLIIALAGMVARPQKRQFCAHDGRGFPSLLSRYVRASAALSSHA